MGLFSFLKEAGEKLFGGDEPSPAEKSEKLVKTVQALGLKAEGFEVVVEGDKAVIKGKALSQEEKEKIILAIGNTEGIGQVEDQFTVAEPKPDAVFYTVKKGDTLSAISKAHYGNPNKYNVIFEANKPMLKHPDKIYPGQVLRIPPL